MGSFSSTCCICFPVVEQYRKKTEYLFSPLLAKKKGPGKILRQLTEVLKLGFVCSHLNLKKAKHSTQQAMRETLFHTQSKNKNNLLKSHVIHRFKF